MIKAPVLCYCVSWAPTNARRTAASREGPLRGGDLRAGGLGSGFWVQGFGIWGLIRVWGLGFWVRSSCTRWKPIQFLARFCFEGYYYYFFGGGLL